MKYTVLLKIINCKDYDELDEYYLATVEKGEDEDIFTVVRKARTETLPATAEVLLVCKGEVEPVGYWWDAL